MISCIILPASISNLLPARAPGVPNCALVPGRALHDV